MRNEEFRKIFVHNEQKSTIISHSSLKNPWSPTDFLNYFASFLRYNPISVEETKCITAEPKKIQGIKSV